MFQSYLFQLSLLYVYSPNAQLTVVIHTLFFFFKERLMAPFFNIPHIVFVSYFFTICIFYCYHIMKFTAFSVCLWIINSNYVQCKSKVFHKVKET